MQITAALAAGLLRAGGTLIKGAGELIVKLVQKIGQTDWKAVGRSILNGIWNGFKSAAKSFGGIIGGLFGGSRSGDSITVPKFAGGGIISGPTLAMVGEYSGARSDPEVISPLSKLQSMIGGGAAADTATLQRVLELLQQIAQELSGGRLGEILAVLEAIRRWLDGYDPDLRLYANDREIARSAARGSKQLGTIIAE